ncbi:MAG TPA: hypothetical protein VMV16_10185 [Solirubrobacteraceae bacterium]|nr:hypothetical protein [Solirubrobacteraceae bacterium]
MWRAGILSTVLVCAVASICAATAASAVPRGFLTRAEYQQLRSAEMRIKSISARDTRGIRQVRAVCSRLRRVSPLIAAVRSGCLDLIALGGDNAKLNATATKCGIDPGSEAAILTCLIPTVRGYYMNAESFYRAESRVNRLARARGFSSMCVAVIGDSPRNISAEGRVAGDLKAAVSALRTQNPGALQTLSGQLDRDVSLIKRGPSSLSVCPHS